MPGRSWPGSAGASPPDEQPLGATPDSTSEPAKCCGSTPRTRCWAPRLNSARVTLHRLRECWCRATSETRCSVYLVIHLSWISRTGTGLRKCSFSRPGAAADDEVGLLEGLELTVGLLHGGDVGAHELLAAPAALGDEPGALEHGHMLLHGGQAHRVVLSPDDDVGADWSRR